MGNAAREAADAAFPAGNASARVSNASFPMGNAAREAAGAAFPAGNIVQKGPNTPFPALITPPHFRSARRRGRAEPGGVRLVWQDPCYLPGRHGNDGGTPAGRPASALAATVGGVPAPAGHPARPLLRRRALLRLLVVPLLLRPLPERGEPGRLSARRRPDSARPAWRGLRRPRPRRARGRAARLLALACRPGLPRRRGQTLVRARRNRLAPGRRGDSSQHAGR